MAVRKTSMRYWRWRLATLAVNALPGLRDRIILYRKAVKADDKFAPDVIDTKEPIVLTPEERTFADLLPKGMRFQHIPDIFEHRLALYDMKNVTLLGNTGVFVDESAREVILFPTMRQEVNYHFMRPVALKPVDAADGLYFSMLHSHKGHRHLFHFMLERLPKLYYLLKEFGYEGRPIKVLIHDKVPQFQEDIYRFIGEAYPEIDYVRVRPDERWRFRSVLFLDDQRELKSTWVKRACLDFIREAYFKGYGIDPEAEPSRRIYISRDDAKKRQLTNAAEAEAVLDRFGFERIVASDLSFAEQVKTFAEAKVVAGVHGAGLTNLMFSPPSAGLFEIFAENDLRNTYFLQARSMGQHYGYAIGGRPGAHASFAIDPAVLESRLSSFLTELGLDPMKR